jgi:hypothetical protein
VEVALRRDPTWIFNCGKHINVTLLGKQKFEKANLLASAGLIATQQREIIPQSSLRHDAWR